MKLNRNELLKVLAAAKPALATKEIVAEAVRFIFTGDSVCSYNDMISITCPFPTDFKCSVSGEEFYKILSSIKEEEIDLTLKDNQLRITAKRTKAGMSTVIGENERVVGLIDKLKNTVNADNFWKKLPEDFIRGVFLCTFSASRDMTTGVRCCVGIKDNCVYSTDNLRISKYVLSGDVEEMLIPARDALELIKYKVTDYGISEGWVHFITEDNVVFNCRTMIGEYPFASISRFFREPKDPISVPQELCEIMKAAAVVAEGEVDVAKVVQIDLEKGLITVRSEDKGKKWMEKSIETEYDGEKVTFYANPIFMAQVLQSATLLVLIQGEDFPDKCVFYNDNFIHVLALPA